LSMKQKPSGFKLEFGSTVTILTTAVADIKHCKRINGQGIYTGVLLEESELRLKRSPKHVLVPADGLESQDAGETGRKECCCHEHKCEDKLNDHECEAKTTQEFVILSLTCPSFPFIPGQIVWISLDQIIALTVLCRN
jgi:hypothetical protein